jgi:hypothetical protein
MARMDVAAAAAVVISALSALGCSDPPEPPARGGLKVQFESMQGTGTACITGSATTMFGVGNPTPDEAQGTIGLPIVSGEEETDVHCSVSKSGAFRATIAAPNVSLDLRGTIGQLGTISAHAPSATLNVTGVNICTFNTAAPYSYHPGEMFIGFDCPGAKNPDYVGTVCHLHGSIVVLRCAE